MLLGAVFFKTIINLWVGHQTEQPILPSTALIYLLFAWNAIVLIQQPFGYLLAGVSHVKRLTL